MMNFIPITRKINVTNNESYGKTTYGKTSYLKKKKKLHTF